MFDSQAIAAGAARSVFSFGAQHDRLLRMHFPRDDGPDRILLPNRLRAHEEVSQRQIAGIVGLEHAEARAWIRHKRGPSLAHGTEVRLTIDEDAFAGASLHLFMQVLDQFFAMYVQTNSFIELTILSHQSGKELFRCKPRSGSMPLS